MAAELDQLRTMRGQTVYSQDGEKVGKIEDFYFDEESGEPEWIGLGTGFLGMKHLIVPAQNYALRDDGIAVPYSKDLIKDSPDIDDDEIGPEREMELFQHFGLTQRQYNRPTGEGQSSDYQRPTGGGQATAQQGYSGDRSGEVTRHEEELRVGKRNVDAGQVRLRKWVETEPVSEEVQLRRETAHVQRQPVNEVVTDAQIGEREVEVSLQREEPVVEKQTVAKERVGLNKDVEQTSQRVEANLARERVEVEGEHVTTDELRERRP